jgi:hypothetical protein
MYQVFNPNQFYRGIVVACSPFITGGKDKRKELIDGFRSSAEKSVGADFDELPSV